MDNSEDRTLDQVCTLFIQWGAAPDQAKTMGRQLLKRAAQIAEERGISQLEATESLLKQVVEARNGA